MKFTIKNFVILVIGALFISFAHAEEPSTYKTVAASKLNLNRKDQPLLIKPSLAHTGFIWKRDDNRTKKWRPQGITGFTQGKKKFLVVSWYGRPDTKAAHSGARLSFVDVTSMKKVKYRHVLLVNKDYQVMDGHHAGGIAYRKGELHVVDTRKEVGGKKVGVFSINDIQEVPESDRGTFKDYRYILKESRSYDVAIKPSTISYDPKTDRFLIASFYEKKAGEMEWYSPGHKNSVVAGN